MQLNKIPAEPDVPEEILDQANKKKLCFFLGAGVSKLIGCKGWSEIAINLARKCFRKKHINHKQLEGILRIKDPKKIITICYNILDEKGSTNDFFKEIKTSLKHDKDLIKKYNIYRELASIPAIFITTNIDTHFDFAFPERIVYKEDDFNPKNIFPRTLYKIHGTIKNKKSIIFTVPQYLDRYRKGNFTKFLRSIFNERTIIFLGYGLEEFEILDFLVTKLAEGEKIEKKHWILLPYYEDEDYLKTYDEEYFKSLGISVVPFRKDEEGYHQLYNVIKKWNNEFNELSNIPHEEMMDMEDTVDNL